MNGRTKRLLDAFEELHAAAKALGHEAYATVCCRAELPPDLTEAQHTQHTQITCHDNYHTADEVFKLYGGGLTIFSLRGRIPEDDPRVEKARHMPHCARFVPPPVKP